MPIARLDLESLRALAGEVALDSAAACALLDELHVGAADCESVHGRETWAAVEAMARAGEPLDAVTLAARLPRVARAEVASVVVDCEMGVARPRLRLLRERSLRRQYVEALRAVAALVKSPEHSLAEAVAEAQRLLSAWQVEAEAIRPLGDAVHGLIDTLEAVQEGRRAPTLPTGLDALDAIIGGLQPTLTMVGGLPGAGKSAFAAGVLRMVAARGVRVGIISLEDEREWLARRLLANAARVPLFVLANRPLGPAQMARVGEAAPAVYSLMESIVCDDRSGLGVAAVVASARRMVAMGCKAVIVDHLGEVALERSDRHDLDISDALRELRVVAKTHRVPVAVLTQLRRRSGSTATDYEPTLTDFAFSAGVERMARVALGLWRKDGELLCTVLKQTQGQSGLTVALQVNAEAGLVVESPASDAARRAYGDDS